MLYEKYRDLRGLAAKSHEIGDKVLRKIPSIFPVIWEFRAETCSLATAHTTSFH